MFDRLHFHELTLLEDMLRSAEEKTYEMYGFDSGIYDDIAQAWGEVQVSFWRAEEKVKRVS